MHPTAAFSRPMISLETYLPCAGHTRVQENNVKNCKMNTETTELDIGTIKDFKTTTEVCLKPSNQATAENSQRIEGARL